MTKLTSGHPDIEALIKLFEQSSEGAHIAGLQGGSLPYLLACLRKRRKGPWLILAESAQQAEKLQSDLTFFSEKLKKDVLIFPAWEPHPFDTFSPHPDVVTGRIEVLYHLLQRQDLMVITTVDAVMQRVIPQETLIDRSIHIHKGGEIDRESLSRQLSENGYSKVSSVEDRGTFAFRGGIFDIFPPLSSKPYRVEFVGDEVEAIRTFEPETQRSVTTNISDFNIIPVREIIYSEEAIQRALEGVKRDADEYSVKKSDRDQILEYIQNQIFFSGIDYYLPYFHERLETFFDYCPETFEVFFFEQSHVWEEAQDFEKECHRDFEEVVEKKRVSAQVELFYLSVQEFKNYLKGQKFWNMTLLESTKDSLKIETQDNQDIRSSVVTKKKISLEVLKPLAEQINHWRDEGYLSLFVAHTKLQQKRLRELFEPYGVRVHISEQAFSIDRIPEIRHEADQHAFHLVCVDGVLSSGFRYAKDKIIFISEEEIFGERKKRAAVAPSKKAPFITSLSELNVGDAILHVDHGIGRYVGLNRLSVGGSDSEYLLIEYADKDKLYLPVHRLNLVQRFVGGEKERIRLAKLGTTTWEKTKKRVKQAIQDIAYELLDVYAARQAQLGFTFSSPDAYFHEFEAMFPYEETPDQFRAIEEVIGDLCSSKPMDRVVCGDVGYGKTEVAIRAAFKVVMDKKQVAVLAPTTLLVDQHYRVFKKRLEKFPVEVEMLSRFVSPTRQKKIIQRIKSGKVDVVIGTHRLLSSDIAFKDLGLLIIDEEQRFGVVHKEKIKKMKKMLDVLTLSATPIPRTLHMSLLGIRDLSVINTPPQDRRAIRTYVTRFDEQTIGEAIQKEIRRGGQVFFVHNRVQSIAGFAKRIQKIAPEAKIRFAHGQMRESVLEKIMIDFLHQKINVLVCTTIIGSGIDIPTANTIIIDRADAFGLSTLYQLRGRVGRSHERAFAYLLVPPEGRLSDDARKRLQVIQGASELGAGFKIASHDLEIRGGGNILGKDQTGHIGAIGFELYTELLEQTVRELKGEPTEEIPDPEMNIRVHAYLPEEYMPDMSDKLTFYRHLATIQSEEELEDIEAEMQDRFGPLPEIVFNLFELMAIKFYLKKLRVKAVDYGNKKVVLTFSDHTPVKPEVIIDLVDKDPSTFRLSGSHKLVVDVEDWKAILPMVRRFAQEWLKESV